MMKTTKKGFTLAEVLTTLMVIGVVAAMTIPTLMNSTNEQQLKVAYKKAMSVLGQGVQLMVAKEVECQVTNSAELAACFADNVMSGTLVQGDGESTAGKRSSTEANNNTIVTSDGLAYSFYYSGNKTKGGTGTDKDDSKYGYKRTLDEICGTFGSETSATTMVIGSDGSTNDDDFSGKNGYCYVIVDVNGLNKGSKYFAKAANAFDTGRALKDEDVTGGDQLPMLLSGNGVRPIYASGASVINKGYGYMYGSGASPLKNATTTTATE